MEVLFVLASIHASFVLIVFEHFIVKQLFDE